MSQTMSPAELEQALDARPYPRVTKELIEMKIAHVQYRELHEVPGLTVCVIVLRNGFFFLGKSAPVDIRNFDPKIGRHFAYEDAFKQIWSHEGYLLKEQLYHSRGPQSDAEAKAETQA